MLGAVFPFRERRSYSAEALGKLRVSAGNKKLYGLTFFIDLHDNLAYTKKIRKEIAWLTELLNPDIQI